MKINGLEIKSADFRYFEAKDQYNWNYCWHGFTIEQKKKKRQKIFLSYCHDTNEELVIRIIKDFENRNHC
jgi:hypothetical protein